MQRCCSDRAAYSCARRIRGQQAGLTIKEIAPRYRRGNDEYRHNHAAQQPTTVSAVFARFSTTVTGFRLAGLALSSSRENTPVGVFNISSAYFSTPRPYGFWLFAACLRSGRNKIVVYFSGKDAATAASAVEPASVTVAVWMPVPRRDGRGHGLSRHSRIRG